MTDSKQIIFDAAFFQGNRRRLAKKVDDELVIVGASGQLQYSADLLFPFRQDSNFWYLTGIQVPEAALVMWQGESFLILPTRPRHADQWDGELDLDEMALRSGLQILPPREGWLRLKSILKNIKRAYMNLPPKSYIQPYSMYTNPASKRLHARLTRVNSQIDWQNIRPLLAELRIIKQKSEIAAISEAISATGMALQSLQVNSFENEGEVDAFLDYGFRCHGGTGRAFPSIVASGGNAATIHYVSNNQPIDHSAMLLVDCGASYEMYNADLTRMFMPRNGASKRQIDVYSAVLAVQRSAIATIKPGLKISDYKKMEVLCMGKELAKLKLIDQPANINAIRAYYPHIGHQLGIDVHDTRIDEPVFAEGMVITVEPGIYIPEEGIGVRIEDDILVTKTGAKNLSGHWLPPEELLQ